MDLPDGKAGGAARGAAAKATVKNLYRINTGGVRL